MKNNIIKRVSSFVLATVLVFLSSFIFTGCKKSKIEGTWLHELEDGRKYYYTFTGDDSGTLEIAFGATIYTGKYDLEDGEINITIDKGEAYAENFVGKYGISISNKNGIEYIALTDIANEETKLYKHQQPQPSDYITPSEDFAENKALTGTWKITYEEMGDMKLTFNSDGTMVLDMFGAEKNYGVYTVTDTVVTISFYQKERYDYNEEYSIKDGKLNILGTTFTK